MRNVAFFRGRANAAIESHTARMRARIDTPLGRAQYGQRFATVEPVFGNVRYNNGSATAWCTTSKSSPTRATRRSGTAGAHGAHRARVPPTSPRRALDRRPEQIQRRRTSSSARTR